MSALSISVPYPVFSGQDGLPLDNGYVWIGTANLYPITNPIAVYFDEALTIQATQPLRTINGFISNAGTPAQVYVDAVNFSILVQDSKGTMVYNFPDGTGISPNADGVVYDPAGIGAVPTTVQAKLRQTVSLADYGGNLQTAIAAAIAGNLVIQIYAPITVRVPTDAPTLQDAFDHLIPVTLQPDQLINVVIEAGHQLTVGLSLKFGDYSHFRISSDDAVVNLALGFTFVTVNNSVLSFEQCHAPDVAIKVDAGGLGGRAYVYQSATGKIEETFGAINAGTDCLYLNSGSIVNAFRTVWNGAGRHGGWVTRTSFLDAEESSFSNATQFGITVRRGSRANITNSLVNDNGSIGLFCTRSYVNFQGREDAIGPQLAECNDNGDDGVIVTRGSQATLTGLKANNNATSGILVASGSIADFDFGTATGNGVAGVRAINAGVVSAISSTITGNDRNIICTGAGSAVDAQNSTLTGSTSVIVQCVGGGRVSLDGATGNNAGTIAIECRDGANVSAQDATFNSAGSIGILCQNAVVSAPRATIQSATTEGVRVISGTVYFQNGNAQRTPGTDTTSDINITDGSIIHANGAVGGYAAAIVPNTISGNRGILFGA
jgi:hypothetical protein